MRRLAVALLCLLAFAGCKSNDKKDSGSTGASTTAATAPPTSTSTSTTIPSGPAQSPQAAADGLFAAWKAHNQDDASRYAKPQAVTKLFSHPYSNDGTTYDRQACTPQGGQFNCAWTYEGGSMQMTVEAWPGGGYVVDSVIWVAD
jgi:hypothetical protein